jgi:hypothetical protein
VVVQLAALRPAGCRTVLVEDGRHECSGRRRRLSDIQYFMEFDIRYLSITGKFEFGSVLSSQSVAAAPEILLSSLQSCCAYYSMKRVAQPNYAVNRAKE